MNQQAARNDQVRVVGRRAFLRGAVGGTAVLLVVGGCAPPASSPSPTSAAAAPTTAPAATAKPTAAAAPTKAAATTAAAPTKAAATPAAAGTATPASSSATAFQTQVDVAAAKKEGVVNFYTSLDPKIVDAIVKPFTDQFGIQIKYYRSGSTAISGKVLAEADAGHVLADVVDASDVGAFIAMKARGILTPYDSPYAKSVDKALRDPDGTWVSDRLTQAVIEWNTQLVKAAPQHWQDLTNTSWNGKLVSFNHAGDAAPRLYTLVQHFNWSLLEKIAATKPLFVETVQLQTQIVETGERQVGYVQNDNIAWRSKGQKKPTDYIFPSEGVPTEPGAIGLVKNAAHPNAAKLWYDWWMSDAGQKLLVAGGKYSSRSDFAAPEGSPPLSKLKLLTLNYDDYQKNRQAVTARMAKIFGGVW